MTFYKLLYYSLPICLLCLSVRAQDIDRKKIYERHKVFLTSVDTVNALTVGNGNFAVTVDITGLQTFPLHYQKGMSLGTQSNWGWHSFPNDHGYNIEMTLDTVSVFGKKIPYAVQSTIPEKRNAADYVRQNPHRIHLAQLGWHLTDEKGQKATPEGLENIFQELNPWEGTIKSTFTWQGKPVEVETFALQDHDAIVVQVKSPLLQNRQLGIDLSFPYPTDTFLDEATTFRENESAYLNNKLNATQTAFHLSRSLDSLTYFTSFNSSIPVDVENNDKGYVLFPQDSSDSWQFIFHFSSEKEEGLLFEYEKLKAQSITSLTNFWTEGAIIDFGYTNDPRAYEIERRMVLSRYLTKVNCSGTIPPQETGLTLNSWYGKPHMEMHWWHVLPFMLWGNTTVFTSQLDWYFQGYPGAKNIALRQGFKGVRWQKMTDPWGGETASSVGSFLIWQQPHILYFTELVYQHYPSQEVLNRYGTLVENTALFMGDFLSKDPHSKVYHLGPNIIPAQESYDPETTLDPTYELTYWRWGLKTAQQWRIRQGLEELEEWNEKLEHLAPLASTNKVYWATASQPHPYENFETLVDHPSVLGAIAMVPQDAFIDHEKMKNTLRIIRDHWQWESCWGWDFPLAAMAAQRLGNGEMALEFLLHPAKKNTYLKNGHNYQTERLRLYLPGNGGFLIALARMAMDSSSGGFPKEWKIKAEGFLSDL